MFVCAKICAKKCEEILSALLFAKFRFGDNFRITFHFRESFRKFSFQPYSEGPENSEVKKG
jgi:hypothetical protein